MGYLLAYWSAAAPPGGRVLRARNLCFFVAFIEPPKARPCFASAHHSVYGTTNTWVCQLSHAEKVKR